VVTFTLSCGETLSFGEHCRGSAGLRIVNLTIVFGQFYNTVLMHKKTQKSPIVRIQCKSL